MFLFKFSYLPDPVRCLWDNLSGGSRHSRLDFPSRGTGSHRDAPAARGTLQGTLGHFPCCRRDSGRARSRRPGAAGAAAVPWGTWLDLTLSRSRFLRRRLRWPLLQPLHLLRYRSREGPRSPQNSGWCGREMPRERSWGINSKLEHWHTRGEGGGFSYIPLFFLPASETLGERKLWKWSTGNGVKIRCTGIHQVKKR